MTLAVTLMIRDEVDVLPDWLSWHVEQGVDVFVITDNGSVDGTTQVLEEFARTTSAVVDLRHDPVHRKQQSATVTTMARDAAVLHGADWVVNADADEFLVAKDRTLSLREVFGRLDPAVRAFVVPVVNMVGPLAERGAGLERLVWRDGRSPEQLVELGLLAQPTGNAIHVGDPDVTVVQGNHLVTLAAGEAPDEALALEVLHFPWRSWQQYAHRTEVSGRAYESNPDAQPSPAHHGMRDYRRLQEGTLKAHFALRHVTDDQAAAGPFVRDTSVPDLLRGTEAGLQGTPDEVVPEDDALVLAQLGRALVRRDDELADLRGRLEGLVANKGLLEATIHDLQRQVGELGALAEGRRGMVEAYQARRVVRYADSVGAAARRVRARLPR